MNLDDWRNAAYKSVEQVGANLDPDADWPPVILMEGTFGFKVMPLDGPTGIQLEKQEGIAIVSAAITKLQPAFLTRIQMAWIARPALDDPNPWLPVSMRDDREEIILLQIAERAKAHEVWTANVTRSDGPPALSEWIQLEQPGGALVDAVRAVML